MAAPVAAPLGPILGAPRLVARRGRELDQRSKRVNERFALSVPISDRRRWRIGRPFAGWEWGCRRERDVDADSQRQGGQFSQRLYNCYRRVRWQGDGFVVPRGNAGVRGEPQPPRPIWPASASSTLAVLPSAGVVAGSEPGVGGGRCSDNDSDVDRRQRLGSSIATGGSSGGSAGGPAGSGGNATATAVGTALGSNSVSVSASAFGGNGGQAGTRILRPILSRAARAAPQRRMRPAVRAPGPCRFQPARLAAPVAVY